MITTEWGQQAALSAEIIRGLKEDHTEADINFFNVIFFTIDTGYYTPQH